MTTPGGPASDSERPGVTVVDARGLRCPLPVIRLAQAAREGRTGHLIEVWATDHAAPGDIAAWCRMRGHDLLGSDERRDGASSTRVRLSAPPTAEPSSPT